LTGLVVPRSFNGRFRQTLAQCVTGGRPLAALMMDMDGLKRINDTHGHHAGAGTIAAVGKLIGEILPDDGLATRFGGDEFTAFAPGFDRARGLELGEQIRSAVKNRKFEFGEALVYPTISIGVAALPDDGNTVEQITRRADEALYRAKAAGRDCVSL